MNSMLLRLVMTMRREIPGTVLWRTGTRLLGGAALRDGGALRHGALRRGIGAGVKDGTGMEMIGGSRARGIEINHGRPGRALPAPMVVDA